jgi:hypothetical protein
MLKEFNGARIFLLPSFFIVFQFSASPERALLYEHLFRPHNRIMPIGYDVTLMLNSILGLHATLQCVIAGCTSVENFQVSQECLAGLYIRVIHLCTKLLVAMQGQSRYHT